MHTEKLRRAIAALAIIGAALSLASCSRNLPIAGGDTVLNPSAIETGIKDWFWDSGTEIETVECPVSMVGVTGDSWLCTATDPWDFAVSVRVTMTSSDGYVEWELAY